MIVFDLECLNGHTFEGWFEDKKDLTDQQEKGILSCPVCETTTIVQKLSAVAIKTTPAHTQPRLKSNQAEAIAELTLKFSEFVEKNFENVGSNFADEAIKMHYGTSEQRNIRGVTTKEDDKMLHKEGVSVVKIPVIKKPEDELN